MSLAGFSVTISIDSCNCENKLSTSAITSSCFQYSIRKGSRYAVSVQRMNDSPLLKPLFISAPWKLIKIVCGGFELVCWIGFGHH